LADGESKQVKRRHRKSADFLVLDTNPLDNIGNTRRISSAYLRGQEVPRATMASGWRAASGGAR
jgi:hypothetical protein